MLLLRLQTWPEYNQWRLCILLFALLKRAFYDHSALDVQAVYGHPVEYRACIRLTREDVESKAERFNGVLCPTRVMLED